MSLSAAGIDALVALGLTAEQLGAVMKAELAAAAAADEARRDAKRAGNSIRQARFKAKQKAQGNASNALPASASVIAPPLDGPPNEVSNPPLNPPSFVGDAPAPLDLGLVLEVVTMFASAALAAAKADKAARYHRLPTTWAPPTDLPDKLAAKVTQWPPGMLDDLADTFRAWASNAKNEQGKGLKLNWDQAWHNWIRDKHDDWQRRTQPRIGSLNGSSSHRPRLLADDFADGFARMG